MNWHKNATRDAQTGQRATTDTADDAPGTSKRDDDRTHHEMTQCNHCTVFDAPNACEETFLPTTHPSRARTDADAYTQAARTYI